MIIVLATRNIGKIAEIKALLPHFQVLPAASYPGCPEPKETGQDFEANALLKARVITEFTGISSLADDSGLEVDALDGAPGVRSARYAGASATDKDNIDRLLEALRGIPDADRTARFRCVMALATSDGRTWTTEGVCEGCIVREPQGTSGFGYDPIFVPVDYENTFGELETNVKNRISHRAIALRHMLNVLQNLPNTTDLT